MPVLTITPAATREVSLYFPYYPTTRRHLLPLALGLYHQGKFQGERRLAGINQKVIPLTLTWQLHRQPAELTLCQAEFCPLAQPPLLYELAFPNIEFIGYLMELAQDYSEGKPLELPQQFYRRILGYS